MRFNLNFKIRFFCKFIFLSCLLAGCGEFGNGAKSQVGKNLAAHSKVDPDNGAPRAVNVEKSLPNEVGMRPDNLKSETIELNDLNWEWIYEGAPEIVTNKFEFKEHFAVSDFTLKVTVRYNWWRSDYNSSYGIAPITDKYILLGRTLSEKDNKIYCQNDGKDCEFVFGRGGLPMSGGSLSGTRSNVPWKLYFYGIDGTHTHGGVIKKATLTLYE
ncbi:MAG: hypothetical protein NT027_05280 [Proteobacteria bacterium]|nr:hypothetical protein [Pseudomonadota bacterium]